MFIKNKVYKRSTLHNCYGGSRQSGIASTQKHSITFIFSGKSGHQYGYVDGWDTNQVFTYTGEGTQGDMLFMRGNKALRDHLFNGKLMVPVFNKDGGAY